jgi:hypothetical protein
MAGFGMPGSPWGGNTGFQLPRLGGGGGAPGGLFGLGGAVIQGGGPAPQFTSGGPAPQMAGMDLGNLNAGPQVGGPTPGAGAAPGTPQAVPGVSGITPGAVERRLNATPPSQQANPVGAGMAGGPSSVTQQMQTQLQGPATFQSPNLLGPDRSSMSSPLMAIQQLLRSRGG